jgi:hypothetical protein
MCHVDDGNSSGTTNIILEGNNTVEHIKQFSSVQNLNISGDGSLTLTGNQSEFDDGCNTVIDGGTITANRLTVGLWSGGNTLTINDGTIHLTQGFWTYLNDGNTTDITINGGDITVGVYYEEYFGGQIYPGIGGNSNNTNKIINVTVNDGTLTFNATDNGYPGNYFIQASTINFGTTNVKSAWDAKTWSADGYQNFGPLRATYTASSHTLVLEPAPAPVIPEGAINSLFSVSATQQVYFSQGNLQYTKSTGVWSFMEHQYDIVETAGTNVGVDYANQDIISLFGHGTSGYNHGATAYQPWSTVLDCAYYYAYGNQNGNLYDSDGTADWGYNAISNGGNTENSGWRTPTHEEWEYLFFTRTDASSKYGYSIVNGLHGMIVLPDEWTLPAGLSFTGGNSYWANVYDADQWAQMEYNGAIFLPATCYRRETTIYDAYESMFGDMEMYSCFYWSSSKYNLYNAWYLGFSTMMNYGNPDYILQTSTNQPFYGYSVRLVKDAE